MRVLVIEPGAKPVVKDIENTLESLQNMVGGYIECVYPFEDPVALTTTRTRTTTAAASHGRFRAGRQTKPASPCVSTVFPRRCTMPEDTTKRVRSAPAAAVA